MKYFHKRLLKSLEPHLDPGETVLAQAWGTTNPRGSFSVAYLGLTDKRVILFARGLLGYAFSYIPIQYVTMVEEATSSLTSYALRIHSASTALVFYPSGGKKERDEVRALAAMIRQRSGSLPEKPSDPDGDALRTLRDLRRMCDEGLISEEEYAEKKREILSRV